MRATGFATLQRVRRAGVGSMLVLALVLASAVPVLAQSEGTNSTDEDVVFDGGGWGHGVGMSQYGAWGESVLGSSHGEILSHYYQGTTLGTLGPNIGDMWVNLERNFTNLTLRVEAVGATGAPVVVSHPWRSVTAEIGATLTLWTHGALGCRVVVWNPGEDPVGIAMKLCRIDFEWYDWTDESLTPTTKLVIDGCTLANWNTSPTTYPECQYARGTLHLRSGDDGLDLSAQMDLEDYVLGISEMPYYWADEGGVQALEAQAIAARSYARELRLSRGSQLATNSCDGWCHVRDTTWDQRYVGWGHGNADWVDAVRNTEDRVVVHDDAPNRVVRSYYFSSSAGLTEDGAEKWGLTPREYYSSVTDTAAVDGTVPNPNASWTVAIPAGEIAAELGIDTLTHVTVSETRPSSGSAAMVLYEGIDDGSYVAIEETGSWTRTSLGLKSEFFTVDFDWSLSGSCVNVSAGDGWWTTSVNLGLPGEQWPYVREHNLHAENDQGYLIVGAEVCLP